MYKSPFRIAKCLLLPLFTILFLNVPVFLQTTEFNYQGNLSDNSQPASGSYDFEFSLFDTLLGGAQVGSTITISAVQVSEGMFSVNLDFGSQFPGAGRWLEIRVKQSAGASAMGGFTTLAPRQAVASSPYAIKSLNAENANTAITATTATNAGQLGGVDSSQYVTTTDTRLSDARTPTAGSGDYIQNSTTQQATGNFNISGTGKANILEVATRYNIGGTHMLSRAGFQNTFLGAGLGVNSGSSNSFFGHFAGLDNTSGSANSFFGAAAGINNTTASRNSFYGGNAGFSNTTGSSNSFFGAVAGQDNTTGSSNSFFGRETGQSNTTGFFNSFFGASAGDKNTIGSSNSFFGKSAGFQNTIGGSNSFFGTSTGSLNTIGTNNSFFGKSAASNNTTGSSNSFFGINAGNTNTTGNGNTAVGRNADVATADLTNATALGQFAEVSTSNSLVLGSINGVNAATADTNVGIGTTAPTERLHIAANSGRILFGDAGCGTGVTAIGFDSTLSDCADYALAGNGTSTFINRPPGGSLFFRENNITQVRINSGGTVEIENLGSGGLTGLCRNPSNEISTCSSSLRYKSNVEDFRSGLELIKKLRPVSFTWTDGGMLDVGLVAEEVAEVEPLLTTTKDGKVEGVKYDRVGVVLVNAVKEQQEQIERQNEKIRKQEQEMVTLRDEVQALKAVICELRPAAAACKKTEN